MRRHFVTVFATMAAALAGGGWATATPVPGLAALRAGLAQVVSMSCASAGNCAAGGLYANASGTQAFVAAEIKGRWGKAIEVPGLGHLNKSGSATVASVSCPTAGYCVAGGFYSVPAGSEGFVVVDTNGRWGKAVAVPGTLSKAGNTGITSVSCGAARSCAGGGSYTDSRGHQQAFVTTETRGRWGRATEVPGLAALNKGGNATVTAVSCSSGGSCGAGGSYATASGTLPFVVTEASGHWGKAAPVAGLAGPSKNQFAPVNAVSCASAGACTAGGYYSDRAGRAQAFVVTEARGRWGKAESLPGLSALNSGGDAQVLSVSCPTPASCAVAGLYAGSGSLLSGFVVTETRGRWGHAEPVPGLAALNRGKKASVASVSCAAAGDCAAGGSYLDHAGQPQAFVVSELNGRWGKAEEVPGTAALNKGSNAAVTTVSCPSAGHCVAGGYYTNGDVSRQAFVDRQS